MLLVRIKPLSNRHLFSACFHMRMKINIEPEVPFHVENIDVLCHNVSKPKPNHNPNIKITP